MPWDSVKRIMTVLKDYKRERREEALNMKMLDSMKKDQ